MSDTTPNGVLITRPEPAAHETALRVAALGFTPVLAPMLVIEAAVWAPMPPVQAVLVTSANALPALSHMDRATAIFAVGDATASRAHADGFTAVASAGRDAASLAALVATRCDPKAGPLLLASGAGQGMALAAALRQRGFSVRRRVAYAAKPARTLPPSALCALDRASIRHALFFSAATARAFAASIIHTEIRLEGIQALALSQPTAHALAFLPWLRIRVASHPNQNDLVDLLT